MKEMTDMIRPGTKAIIDTYCRKNAALEAVREELTVCVELLVECFQNGGKLLICGNGGSCADADHIVGELVKAFRLKRPLEPALLEALQKQGEQGRVLAERLQSGLPVINLGAHAALTSAMQNDVGGQYAFAQQVVSYGRKGDVLMGISTSGNSANVRYAGAAAKARGMKTVGLTGRDGGWMGREFDLVLRAAADSTEDVQDLHSVMYHAICAAVEYQFWGD